MIENFRLAATSRVRAARRMVSAARAELRRFGASAIGNWRPPHSSIGIDMFSCRRNRHMVTTTKMKTTLGRRRMAKHLMAAAVVLVLAGLSGAQAQDYPTRTATVIVPFAAGGPADITGRLVADIFSRYLGQKFVVENVGGCRRHHRSASRRPRGGRRIHDPVRPPRHQCAGAGVLSESGLRSAKGLRADWTDGRVSGIAGRPQRFSRQQPSRNLSLTRNPIRTSSMSGTPGSARYPISVACFFTRRSASSRR